MNRIQQLLLCLVLFSSTFLLFSGCQKEEPSDSPDFSNVSYIAELSSIECYYHNVSTTTHEGSWFLKWGFKKLWYEYTGIVEYGIDASKVDISQPSIDGEVTITIPQAEVLKITIDEDSFTEPLTRKSYFSSDFTAEERKEALAASENEMRKDAEEDDNLKAQARTRAKELLSNYVKNVGEEIGQTYTIKWVDVE